MKNLTTPARRPRIVMVGAGSAADQLSSYAEANHIPCSSSTTSSISGCGILTIAHRARRVESSYLHTNLELTGTTVPVTRNE